MLDHERSKHLVAQTMLGQPVPRAVSGPLAVHYCASLAGVSMREYTLDPRALADCVICYHETFHPDAVWLSADTWVTAQAMGAAVAFPTEYQPMAGTGSPLVRSLADIDRIPAPDPGSQGRWPTKLEAYLRQLDAAPGRHGRIGGRCARTGSSGRHWRRLPGTRARNRHLGQSRPGGPAGSRDARECPADDRRPHANRQ
jgi:Uroporphyrinogen decarboxylase (URO-D)